MGAEGIEPPEPSHETLRLQRNPAPYGSMLALAESGRIELLRLIAAPRFSKPLAVPFSGTLRIVKELVAPKRFELLRPKASVSKTGAATHYSTGPGALSANRTHHCGFAIRRLADWLSAR